MQKILSNTESHFGIQKPVWCLFAANKLIKRAMTSQTTRGGDAQNTWWLQQQVACGSRRVCGNIRRIYKVFLVKRVCFTTWKIALQIFFEKSAQHFIVYAKKWKFTNITRNKEYFFNGIFVFWQQHVNLYDLRYKNCWSLSKLFIIENFNALLFVFYAFKIKLEKFKLVFFNNKFLYNRFQVLNIISTVQRKFYQKVSFPKAINFSVSYKLTMNSACK